MRYFLPLFLFCLFFSTVLAGQGKPKTITLAKGQAFDIILFNNAPDAKEELQDYFKRAFPIALQHGYKPGEGFGISSTPTGGNYRPDVLVTGTWPSIDARVTALKALYEGLPDFDEMRRSVWTTFNLTYYEIKEDFTFTTDTSKYYVATMFWAEKNGAFSKFLKKWEANQQDRGGKALLKLTDGTSPFGYHYDPDYLVITEWASEADFQLTLTDDRETGFQGVRHLNQFPID